MLHAALTGLILLVIFKLLDKRYLKKDQFHAVIDWYMSFAVVMAASVIIALFNIAVISLALPSELTLISALFYLIIPFGIIKLMLGYKTQKALSYAIWVPLIAILVEMPFALVANQPNA